jgi:hypothetical protein
MGALVLVDGWLVVAFSFGGGHINDYGAGEDEDVVFFWGRRRRRR